MPEALKGQRTPLASAIVTGTIERGVTLDNAKEFESHTGKGISGQVNGQVALLGNKIIRRAMALIPGSDYNSRTNAGRRTYGHVCRRGW